MLLRRIYLVFDFRKYSKRKRIHFLINLVIGVLIVLLFHFIEDTTWGESTLDTFLDRFILSESIKASQEAKSIQEARILFIDIDDQTMHAWGDPLLTPRDKIAEIIDLAYAGEARAIVLDIVLEEKDCCNEKGDQYFADTLKKILLDSKNTNTKIVFAQTVGKDGHLNNTLLDDLYGFQESIGQSQERKFYRGSPRVGLSPYDSVVRYWDSYETYIGQDGQRTILWGLPMIATGIAAGSDLHELESYGQELLKNRKEGHVKKIRLGEGQWVKMSPRKSDRYLQRMRFELVPDMGLDDEGSMEQKEISSNLGETKIAYDEIKYYQQYLRDRIIVVGNSSAAMGDIHKTPIGRMPGMYIHGNAVHTLLYGRQPSPPPAIISILIEAVVIILAAYAFLYFTSILAQIIVSLFIVVVFGFVSYIYFIHTGVFLNFVFALVGMGMHETASDIEEIFESRGKKTYQEE
jgi:hypothetical protein